MALYIPPKIKVGQVERDGTFLGCLAYVIPSEKSGNKFRQEDGWLGWLNHHKEVGERLVFDNKPRRGYFLNKSIKRVSYSSFGSTVQKMRIFDDRGFEFEIDMKNIAMLAQSCDISKGEILQDCVLAWDGKNVVVLPTTAAEYIEIVGEKLKNKEHKEKLKSGEIPEFQVGQVCSSTKNKNKYVYLGEAKNSNYVQLAKGWKRKDFVLNGDKWFFDVKTPMVPVFIEIYESIWSRGKDDKFHLKGATFAHCHSDIKSMVPTDVFIDTLGPSVNNQFKTLLGNIKVLNGSVDVNNTLVPVTDLHKSMCVKNEAFFKMLNKMQDDILDGGAKSVVNSGYVISSNMKLMSFEIIMTKREDSGRFAKWNTSITVKDEATNDTKTITPDFVTHPDLLNVLMALNNVGIREIYAAPFDVKKNKT